MALTKCCSVAAWFEPTEAEKDMTVEEFLRSRVDKMEQVRRGGLARSTLSSLVALSQICLMYRHDGATRTTGQVVPDTQSDCGKCLLRTVQKLWRR